MTQMEFAKRTGFSNSAISDWKRKKTNPSAEKIMDICYALDITPEQLLTGKGLLKEYVGQFFQIASSEDVIYIGNKLPDEFTGSKYTRGLKGTVAKAKANAAQGIPELIEIATDKHFKENQGNKHQWNARYGWCRYNSRFALPVFSEDGIVERYNVFHASLLIRHDNNGKMYLYDVLDIKKETSNPLES